MFWVTTLVPVGPAVTFADHLWLAGAVVIALVMFECAFVAVDTLRRAMHAGAQRAREARLLEERVAVARKRRDAVQNQVLAWNGWRKFTVASRAPESGDVCSFYLKPHDGKPLPPFKPGQYLTFRLDVPGQSKPVIRCYSLSDCEHEDYYRVSIRRVGARDKSIPPGMASCFFHDQLRVGEIVDVKAPSGSFFLDMETTHPVVLLSSGIGVTPNLSMLNAIIRAKQPREVYFFYGVGNRTEHSFRQHIEQIAQRNSKVHLHVFYSRPLNDDVPGKDFHAKGRLTIEGIKKVLPSNNFHYYLCGPPGMMEALIRDLKAWGVPEAHIHSEAFGAPARSAIATAAGTNAAATSAKAAQVDAIEVQFARSGKTASWRPDNGTLLEFAEAHQVAIPCGCRAGNCGTCMIAIKKGNVFYQTEPGFAAETGSCLTCCCTPKSDLILDA
ncbi:MAG TPA: 2Fe-2S iron-sulfur cluster-binding protein [Tepidisphaeraceae bacterium]|jgi:hypothetical protein|nr:2Fe-2S iron-sulfur cluster-binding protein [Tepidisphaeraceae bacterium]